MVTSPVLDIALSATRDLGANQHPGELERYLHWLSATQPKYIVELGVESGGTSWAVRQVCPQAQMIAVDINRPAHLDRMLPPYQFVQARTDDVYLQVQELYDPREAVVLIDADHHYESVVRDAERYPARYQAFHDIFWVSGNNAPEGQSSDRFYQEHRACCFIHTFSEGWAGIGIRMPEFCRTRP